MVSIDLRLKLRHWFRKYRKVAFVVVSVFLILLLLTKEPLVTIPASLNLYKILSIVLSNFSSLTDRESKKFI